MYPSFQLDTPHGPITVTVFDPTPRAGKSTEEPILRLDAEGITINRVLVNVHKSFTRYPNRDRESGTPNGTYSMHGAHGLHRVGSYDAVPEGVRKTVTGYAEQGLARVTPVMLAEARATALTDTAARKREQAQTLRREAEGLEAEAAGLERLAQSV